MSSGSPVHIAGGLPPVALPPPAPLSTVLAPSSTAVAPRFPGDPAARSNGRDPYPYIPGFMSYCVSEALPGALPDGQNSPQVAPYGLYAEQLSGTAFTVGRHENLRSWLYRIRPSVCQSHFTPLAYPRCVPANPPPLVSEFAPSLPYVVATPEHSRFPPFPLPKKGDPEADLDFWEGLRTVCGVGSASNKIGLAVHVYFFARQAPRRAGYSSDGDFLIVPQQGILDITTEFGRLSVSPNEIAVVQRGIKFRVGTMDGEPARGYVLELHAGHFDLPDLGPIGANGLANHRDFMNPVAYYEDDAEEWELVCKFQGKLWRASMDHSPFDVVAYHGNYVPYKYDLAKFCAVNSVSFDHIDPSIYTVLTAKNPATPGTATADFVIFPPRWTVMENSFRPPWYHRNTMSEFMGLIQGAYEAKGRGLLAGGATLHPCMTSHGPDSGLFLGASRAPLKPERVADGTQTFMFEAAGMLVLTEWAMGRRDTSEEYVRGSWSGLRRQFDPTKRQVEVVPEGRAVSGAKAARL
ncbi:homogentisate 1,2-dioxygenase-like protein [Hyaloraphidium curvatum]|nr:homogentisate 1,2-dioxygenase-like protein [Hyaloraphidium curvatum]